MKFVNKTILFILILLATIAISCNASKKGSCGCPNEKGYIGY